MSELTPVSLSKSTPFPVTVSALLCKEGDTVQKHQPVLKFKYWDLQEDPQLTETNPPKIPVERVGTFESPIEGEVCLIDVTLQQEISDSEVRLISIKEPCSHQVQYGGLCAVCGLAVEDEKDYTGYRFEDRAQVNMSYDNDGLMVSLLEAAKIDKSSSEMLAQARKLILVVDLDQTVIHATVDPTVGEWQLDPSNPNYPAVKDVRSFTLEEEPMAVPGWKGPKIPPTKFRYYVKVRPGLEDFLAEMHQLYEMHIYTMATRNYALAIAKIIDPDGRYFRDRILSRDESGSLTHKNLKRLFPVDQSMAAIIDDRGDVWQWENNLIKVVPYDFFVGIGDINSSFLPRKNGQITGPTKRRRSLIKLEQGLREKSETENEKSKKGECVKGKHEKSESKTESGKSETNGVNGTHLSESSETIGETEEKSVVKETTENKENTSNILYEYTAKENLTAISGNVDGNNDNENEDENEDEKDDEDDDKIEGEPNSLEKLDTKGASPVDRLLELGGGEDNKSLLIEQSITRNQSIEQQQHDRPLAKLQHNLQKLQHESVLSSDSDEEEDENLLYDDDNELVSLNRALVKIHAAYFSALDALKPGQAKPNLTNIIPALKSNVLEGVVVLFSGILPLGIDIDSADIVIWCRQFGVKVTTEVDPEVTHVICRDPSTGAVPTFKIKVAKKLILGARFVNPDWLFACLSTWSQVDEVDYEVDWSEEDFFIEDRDVKQYQRAMELRRQENYGMMLSLSELDFDVAHDMDELFAGLSEEEDWDRELKRKHDGDEPVAKKQRSEKQVDEEIDEEDKEENLKENEEEKEENDKKEGDDLYQLEQELLEGWDEIE